MPRRFVICVALALCACRDNEVEKLAKIRDEICSCKTATCAEAALDRVPKASIESTPRAQDVAREMLSCLAEIYSQGQPTQDPDAPEPPAPASPATQ